jgi:hypothetical protein
MAHDGAWIPWPAVELMARLKLKRPSTWRIFFVITATAARYGGVAKLGVEDLARLTALSPRTVKTAVAELLAAGLIIRLTRYRKLVVPLLDAPAASARSGFTDRQAKAVERALIQASKLMLTDISKFVMSADESRRLGLQTGVTYGAAFDQLRGADPARCQEFVGIVLALRHGERVAGRRL